MATSIRFEHDSAGIRALLTDPEMQQAMEAKAEEIAQRARARGVMVEGEPGDVPLPIEVVPAHGRTRARALVVIDHPSGVAAEAKDRILGGALG